MKVAILKMSPGLYTEEVHVPKECIDYKHPYNIAIYSSLKCQHKEEGLVYPINTNIMKLSFRFSGEFRRGIPVLELDSF